MTTSATLMKLSPDLIDAIDRRRNYQPRHAAPDEPAVGVAQVPRAAPTPLVARLGALIAFRPGRRP